ncbi:MAG TPA: type II secretion system F family protein, partial [Mycobacterium sp.]|nr:type II secretion system F family protein [Mycobacterium sp.]
MTWAAMFLAAALLLGANPTSGRIRGAQACAPARFDAVRAGDPLAFASTLDVLAACLRSGMAVASAASAAAPSAPPPLGQRLRRAADLLALGADPSAAWANTTEDGDRHTDALLRLARRSASSGAALAQGIEDLAGRSRDDAADAARAAAERAAVLIAGPLGVCYLPAF